MILSKKILLLFGGRIPYLWRDDFTTAQATPLVTRKADVIGDWLFTDTNSKISVANNLLNFATGAAVNDGGWGNIRTRQAGRIFIARIIPSEAVNGIPAFGWDSNTSGAINDKIKFTVSGILQISPNSGTGINVGVYTATTYWVVAIMRAIGVEWFIRGGTFAYWTKLLPTAAGTGSGYPAITVETTTTVFTAGNARAPDILWLPAPIASDGFSIANSTDGLGHPEGVTGGLGAGGGGKTWVGATWTVSGGVAYNTPSLGSDMFDAGAGVFTSGTYGWVKYGTNTIANVGNELVVTYVDSEYGAYLNLRNATDLNANLIVGQWYAVQYDAKVNTGSSIGFRSANPVTTFITTVTSTNFITIKNTWRAGDVDDCQLLNSLMSAGEIAYWDNISIKQIDPTTLHRNIQAGTANVIVEVQSTGMTNPATQVGVEARLASDFSSGIQLIWDGAGNIHCNEWTATVTYSNLMAVVKAWAVNDKVQLHLNGTAYRCYHITAANVITLLGSGTCTVTGSLGTDVGCFGTDAGNTIDNFRCDFKGNEGQYENDLNRFMT